MRLKGRMRMEQDQKNDNKSIGIQFPMDAETNRLLEMAAKASHRTKKAEARIRLAESVRTKPIISSVSI
jgi:hypothetical protein